MPRDPQGEKFRETTMEKNCPNVFQGQHVLRTRIRGCRMDAKVKELALISIVACFGLGAFEASQRNLLIS
jgi:alkylhydroperoxidase/carboxymuconolactone decarboxylase family protein YurZ